MYTSLTITSTKQGLSYNADEAARGFAIFEKLSGFAGALLRTVVAVGAVRTAVVRPVAAT